MNQREAVATFVMHSVNLVLAGSWDDMYPRGPFGRDYPEMNMLSADGAVEAYNFDGKGFEIEFGGELYRVTVSKVRKP